MITKEEAGYVPVSPSASQCANCSMSRMGNCTLVIGIIEPYAVCQYWEANPGDTDPVAARIGMGGRDVSTGL